MEALMQSRAGFPIARPFQELLLRTANECSVCLPNDLMALPGPPKMVYMMDDFIDACTRPTYDQPVEDIHLNDQPTFGGLGLSFEFREPGESARLSVLYSEEGEAHSPMQICNRLNTSRFYTAFLVDFFFMYMSSLGYLDRLDRICEILEVRGILLSPGLITFWGSYTCRVENMIDE